MKKAGILILVLIIAVVSGLAVYHYTSIPKEEGIAHLKPIRTKIDCYLSSYVPIGVREQEKPQDFLDLPKGLDASENLAYFRIPCGREKKVDLVILKETDTKMTAWVDTNMNLKFSDEKPIRGRKVKISDGKKWGLFSKYSYYVCEFDNIQVHTDTYRTIPFNIWCNEGVLVRFYPPHYQSGKIKLGDQIYEIAVMDGDFDGEYNSQYQPFSHARYTASDIIALDSDKDGKFNEVVPLGQYFLINETYYKIALTPDGKTAQLYPEEPLFGRLSIQPQFALSDCTLFSDAATQNIDIHQTVNLPAGRYQMRWGSVTFTDDNNDRWGMHGTFLNDSKNGQFEILPDTETALNIGPPFSIAVETLKLEDQKIGLNPKLTGNNGEEYSLLLLKNGNRCQAPTLSIIDENNQVIESGQMEFG